MKKLLVVALPAGIVILGAVWVFSTLRDRSEASAVQLERADVAFARALGWEEAGTSAEDTETPGKDTETTAEAPPPPPPSTTSPTVVRLRRGGLVGRAKKLRDQLGRD